jgi:hypothetical protein
MSTTDSPIDHADIVQAAADAHGPPPVQRQQATERYDDIGRWCRDHGDLDDDLQIYPQGSIRIGTTTVDPLTGEFDVDAVLRYDRQKDDITQNQLRNLNTKLLRRYATARQAEGHPLAPRDLEPKRRAVALLYDDPFHLDVLPVIPDLDADASIGDPSLLTDRELVRWQSTNPRGFAAWFDRQSQREREVRLAAKAARAEVTVDELPPDAVTTTLQQSVRILKLHARSSFALDDDTAPPSIVVTTLAARAYAHVTPDGGTLAQVLRLIVRAMPDMIQRRRGQVWIPNPVNHEENFADRFVGHPGRERALYQWLRQLATDLDVLRDARGLDQVADVADSILGQGSGQRIARRLAAKVQEARTAGRLASMSTGALAIGGASPHRDHTFYGAAPR